MSETAKADAPTPEQIALVERLRDDTQVFSDIAPETYRQRASDLRDALTALLAERAALREALDGMVAALSSPENDTGACSAHGEEMDLCDGCRYDRERRMMVAADVAMSLLSQTEGRDR